MHMLLTLNQKVNTPNCHHALVYQDGSLKDLALTRNVLVSKSTVFGPPWELFCHLGHL